MMATRIRKRNHFPLIVADSSMNLVQYRNSFFFLFLFPSLFTDMMRVSIEPTLVIKDHVSNNIYSDDGPPSSLSLSVCLDI